MALRYLHGLNPPVAHRDVKAANVLLRSSTSDPRGFSAKLADYGFALPLTKVRRACAVGGGCRVAGGGAGPVLLCGVGVAHAYSTSPPRWSSHSPKPLCHPPRHMAYAHIHTHTHTHTCADMHALTRPPDTHTTQTAEDGTRYALVDQACGT